MRRLLRGVLALLAALAALVGVPGLAEAQDRAVRFELARVGDTTFVVRTGAARWIHPGQTGVAVDPGKRDELVARFRVLSVTPGQAEVLITGQTTRLTIDHVAVLMEPRPPWYRTRHFWFGLVGGLLVGFGAGQL